jgi:hypothetical protein
VPVDRVLAQEKPLGVRGQARPDQPTITGRPHVRIPSRCIIAAEPPDVGEHEHTVSVRVATGSSPSSRLTLTAPAGTRWPPQPSSANIICPLPLAGMIAEIAEEMRENAFYDD